ncbi:Myb-like domain-containing protein [Mycena indigotica]|uniref:SWR1-complex protein 4 n=1 Tax=Mycena indigotica TaxID=2126181 RepID=A0A8H6SP58_9AGAR|nr:Myb-like domain-containing protein [Mycena indigotica]KAF7301827.1 Myb-like domain-containing protein [Mycena indigotica]
MATSAEVRSILDLPAHQPIAGPSQPKKPTASAPRKPEGISRELYSLIGPSSTTLVAQFAKPQLKQKPTFGASAKVKWYRNFLFMALYLMLRREWRSFKNGGRADSLQLNHWTKATSDANSEYQFAKYNVQRPTFTYSDDEYNSLLQEEGWTREETDYLMSLVKDYDTRWYIIHDRYEYPRPEDSPRSLEDLKDRYCGVCRKLIRNRPWTGDDASRQALLAGFNFEKDREVLRKKYITSLENRTPQQIAEEEALYVEIKRLEQNERRFKRERDDLLRTVAGIESGLPDVVEDDAQLAGILADPKRKKRGNELDSPSTPLSAPSFKRTIKSSAQDIQHCITRTEPNGTFNKSHQVAYLRSFKIPYPKAAQAQKVVQAMTELGISSTRLVMPTAANLVHLENVMDAATNLVETKRNVDRVEFEIQVLRGRLGMQTTAPKNEDGEPMELEDADGEAEPEEGRAQSVVSTRSARKQHRRSMSISSVDTSVSARKRQRK